MPWSSIRRTDRRGPSGPNPSAATGAVKRNGAQRERTEIGSHIHETNATAGTARRKGARHEREAAGTREHHRVGSLGRRETWAVGLGRAAGGRRPAAGQP